MNPNYPHPILAREGWPFIAATFLLAALWTSFVGFGFIAAVLWVLFILVTQFFRDPARECRLWLMPLFALLMVV